MAGILNIGDILMLSQLAWKIGRAFTAGRKSAPAEFLEVETEVSGLAKALKMLAETLFADNSGESAGAVGGTGEGIREEGSGMLARASAETRGGVEVILQSCRQTLRDLESLVEQYQVIRKHRTSGGFSIERSWSDLVLSAYKKMLWTAEGGNIQALRNMLHMHTSTITLTMQALQSRSLSRLEETVHPMAEKVDEIHSAVTGDLSDKIQDVHAVVMALAGASSPRLNPRDSHASDLPVWDSPLPEPMPEALRIGYYSPVTADVEKIFLERSMTTRSQQDAFEKEAFRDSAILCELRVADGVEIVPHASYFVPEKISLPLVAELRFHDKVYGAKPIKVEKTTWVNYVFEDVKSGTLFQNELMGRILVGVFKTEKTLRVHEGFSGVLTYQEQMCGMENLRLWANPASGGVLAMIHFSAQFRAGYLAFYLNSSNCPVRVKDEGGKEVKIKGLKIPMDRNRAGIGGRRGSESGKVEGKKWITGARVEFASDVEKLLFLEKVKEVQQTMILLPDM
ncbi:hypothetical protein UCDDS831_g04597 [Diplodia seriata]|uniref:Fungal N-terminal domain-containing protein n=1 Tax=Diplodia seriata TaxID=420778 RepID=A0A0G2GUX9_9PEZI|nr:hypothetical protein UCDDS831_g04597 [Diplodia seriata]